MVKFSLPAEDDGEGPSGRVPKRQRVQPGHSRSGGEVQIEERPPFVVQVVEEDDEESGGENNDDEEAEEDNDDDVDNGEDEDEGVNEVGSNPDDDDEDPVAIIRTRELSPEPMAVCRDWSISATLTDPEVLDCPICYEPLTVPVFQCDNGHVACNSCCHKIKNKCAACSSPIGYNRCRAIEKVLESVKISCQYRKYGCTESFAYGMKLTHDKTCAHSPCACPLLDCSFLGSSTQLVQHFDLKHNNCAIPFRLQRPKSITIGIDEKYVILREELDGSLFIVDNRTEILGNMITVSRIGPSTMGSIPYNLVAQSLECTLKMQSVAKFVSKRMLPLTQSGFLLVPAGFFGLSRRINLVICIGL